ncbi:AMP-dependent synthetase/ligase [Hazenella coriacea]|uniref:Long-chain acyl-CoA synthetase n=1 Tax=Hazenella coriacea TaxID=1179467 RepID=A0A4R3L2D4_9BACL|nr:long-chain fatty acid--CoA ligase [Hazenella coriacea]TCS92851.1 long-chain acyl-CoA synthetase [Hazenella coriacea]
MKSHNLIDLLAKSVKKNSNQIALQWKQEGVTKTFTYQKLWNTVRDFAFGLERLGIRANSKVAILGENHPHWLISDLAILSLGAITVPIHLTFSTEQIHQFMKQTDVETIIVQDSQMLKRLHLLDLPVKHLILMQGTPNEDQKALQFETVIQMGQTIGIEELDWAYPSIQPSDLATIVFTSGTTGQPKAVMLSHLNILHQIESFAFAVPYSVSDIFLSVLPMSHTFERITGQFAPLGSGATIAYTRKTDNIQQTMIEVKPTIILTLPQLLEKLHKQLVQEWTHNNLKQKLFDWASSIAKSYLETTAKGFNWSVPNDLRVKHTLAHLAVFSKIRKMLGGQLRLMISCGAPLQTDVSSFFAHSGVPIIESYGLTECSSIVLSNQVHQMQNGTIGSAIPGTEIRILPDGELLVKSPSIMVGYYKQEEETAQTMSNGWLHTGDLVEWNENGSLRFFERKEGHFELSTGQSIEPRMIEQVLATSPYIKQAIIVGKNHDYLTALIIPNFTTCMEYAERKQLLIKNREELIRSNEIVHLFQQEIDRLLVHLEPFQQPKQFTLLDHELSLGIGELTPLLQTKLEQVELNYTAKIATMYSPTHTETAVTESSTKDKT